MVGGLELVEFDLGSLPNVRAFTEALTKKDFFGYG